MHRCAQPRALGTQADPSDSCWLDHLSTSPWMVLMVFALIPTHSNAKQRSTPPFGQMCLLGWLPALWKEAHSGICTWQIWCHGFHNFQVSLPPACHPCWDLGAWRHEVSSTPNTTVATPKNRTHCSVAGHVTYALQIHSSWPQNATNKTPRPRVLHAGQNKGPLRREYLAQSSCRARNKGLAILCHSLLVVHTSKTLPGRSCNRNRLTEIYHVYCANCPSKVKWNPSL